MREIEVKLKVEDTAALVEKLRAQGCELGDPIRQHDAIYAKAGDASPWEHSKEGQVVMRIRRQGDKAEFNLKQQRTNELDNAEFETEVSDADAVHEILTRIGYAPQVEVKKVRRKGTWKGCEVCVDEVDGLGGFIEIEKLTDDAADPHRVQEELLAELESLGLSRADQELRGYDTQIFHLHRLSSQQN